MRAFACAWACAFAAGCYLQPTVFETSEPRTPVDLPVRPDPMPIVDAPVGCITHEPGGRRHPGKWWLDRRRVSADEIERQLLVSPLTASTMVRARRERRLALALFLTGFALVGGSIGGILGWSQHDLEHDPTSRAPLVLLAPMAVGYALGFASVPLAVRADRRRRGAIDAFNDAAAAGNRCPP